jgi:arylsulfatase
MNKLLQKSILFGLAASPITGFCRPVEKTQTPNIILIFMDDLGYGDLSCYGASQYKTPNLDRMAAQGIRFTSFMSAQAVCSASRAGMLTGCYPNRVGISGALMPDAKIGLNPSFDRLREVTCLPVRS